LKVENSELLYNTKNENLKPSFTTPTKTTQNKNSKNNNNGNNSSFERRKRIRRIRKEEEYIPQQCI